MRVKGKNVIPFHLPGFEITNVEEHKDRLIVQATSLAKTAKCPQCQKSSGSVHSYYTRTPRDLPSSNQQICLVLGVRRFRCKHEICPQKTFAERIPELVPVHGQRTVRLTKKLRDMVFETSAEGCSRQTHHMNMGVSGDTLLRIIRQTELPDCPTPEVVGIDDWAYKKGTRYGTLLIDQETSKPIELLSNRKAETVKEWLQKHPGIRIITRDRSQEYIAGISTGAPDAIQVADRWHLLCNLREALEKLMKKHARDIKSAAKAMQSLSTEVVEEQLSEPDDSPQIPGKREQRFQAVKALASQGYTQRAIAKKLQMSRVTVKQYLEYEELPELGPWPVRPTIVTPYAPYIEARWAEGCHNSRILWEEIKQRGFPGSYGTVRRFVQRYRTKSSGWARITTRDVRPVKVPSSRQASWLLLRKPDDLDPDDQGLLEQLSQLYEDISIAHHLARRFVTMVCERQADQFDTWLSDAENCGVSDLTSFAAGIRRDYAAVHAALTYKWSNGPVEGHVNRLKVLKRLMYGRAKFDLLRIRVLHPT